MPLFKKGKNMTATVLDMAAQDMHRATDLGLFYAALSLALSVPGICASMEMENGWSGKNEYINWCERYICKHLGVSGDALYQARCGIVHQGRGGFAKAAKTNIFAPEFASGVTRVIFVALRRGSGGSVHCNQMNDAIQFDIVALCDDMTASLNQWKKDTKKDAIVQGNMDALLSFHPDGLHPYIGGMPVIG
jgi:hypothetical protein